MVDKTNMGIGRPSKKLDPINAGLIPITKVVGKCAFCMQLQEGSQAQPTFHIPLLQPYRVSLEEHHRQRPQTLEPIDGEFNYIVREIVGSGKNNKKKEKPIQYLALWEGYPDAEGTWETDDKLKGTVYFFFFLYSHDPAFTFRYGGGARMNPDLTVSATRAVTACKPIGANTDRPRHTTQP